MQMFRQCTELLSRAVRQGIKINSSLGQSRQASTAAANIKLNGDHLEIHHSVDNSVKVNYSWLRDHCKCEHCTHPLTGQKMKDTRSFDHGVKPVEAEVIDRNLKINWGDGHRSVFDAHALADTFLARTDKKIDPVYWDLATIQNEKVEKIPYEDYIKDAFAVKKLMTNILTYGFGLVKGAPLSEEIAEQSMERLGPIMVTHEGRLEIIGRGIKHNDISYSSAYLPLHTDLPYMSDPPGITFLHCLQRQCEGGATLVVDGFRIAKELQKDHPEEFDILCKGQRRFEHCPPGIHFTNSFPVCNLHPFTGELLNIRYGTIYMQELSIAQDKAQLYYSAMKKFEEKIHDPEYQLPVVLEEGDQVYFDNWRIIHGRTLYSGERTLAVCSMKMDDLRSRGRMLGLL